VLLTCSLKRAIKRASRPLSSIVVLLREHRGAIVALRARSFRQKTSGHDKARGRPHCLRQLTFRDGRSGPSSTLNFAGLPPTQTHMTRSCTLPAPFRSSDSTSAPLALSTHLRAPAEPYTPLPFSYLPHPTGRRYFCYTHPLCPSPSNPNPGPNPHPSPGPSPDPNPSPNPNPHSDPNPIALALALAQAQTLTLALTLTLTLTPTRTLNH
jgi:hypothetical protein